MKKIVLTVLSLSLTAFILGIYEAPQNDLQMFRPEGGHMRASQIKRSKRVLTFPTVRKETEVKSLAEFEDGFQGLSVIELEQELARIEAVMKEAKLIELANADRLTPEGRRDLLGHIRSKAVLSMLLFLEKQREEL